MDKVKPNRDFFPSLQRFSVKGGDGGTPQFRYAFFERIIFPYGGRGDTPLTEKVAFFGFPKPPLHFFANSFIA